MISNPAGSLDAIGGGRLLSPLRFWHERSLKWLRQAKPNILIIWGDDIGWFNISAYNHGIMGYKTPNIDRIAKEGAMFTDWYGQQSCTAGRAAFITGQSPIRTGLTKVGLPGAKLGLQPEDPTIAELLKPQGYVCGQFGKNHLGDRDEFLPTVHGFDEFFGNLYHLNAEEEPENEDYPKPSEYPNFKKKFGPRGVLHTWANPDGTQKIEDTGPLTKKRMETMDEEITAGAIDFIERQTKADKPFFCWWNSTKMHVWTHLKEGVRARRGWAYIPMAWSSTTAGRTTPRQARRAGDRRQHHRDVLDRQRRRGIELAGRRGHAVPRREGHQLGRRLARAVRDPLAGRHQAGHGLQRSLLAPGYAAHTGGGSRRTGHRREMQEGLQGRQQDLQGPSRWLQSPPASQG